MKKLTALILTLLLTLSLVSCAGSSGSGAGSAPASGESVPSETSAEPEETTEPEAVLETGTTQDGVYTNAFLGLTCTLDESWTIASQSELLEMIGLTADAVADEDLAETIQSSGLLYDFYATAQDGLVSLNVVIEDLGTLYGLVLNESTYIEASQDQVIQAMEGIGMEDIQIAADTITFAGQEHSCCRVECTMNGISFYEAQVCVKAGNYMAVVTAASFQEDVTGDLLELFTAAE